jgi:hypothetical protein
LKSFSARSRSRSSPGDALSIARHVLQITF